MAFQTDPFNYPMPNRKDLMSLQTIDPMRDNAKTTTKKFTSGRTDSNNLTTQDITGKSLYTTTHLYIVAFLNNSSQSHNS